LEVRKEKFEGEVVKEQNSLEDIGAQCNQKRLHLAFNHIEAAKQERIRLFCKEIGLSTKSTSNNKQSGSSVMERLSRKVAELNQKSD
jgi:hypothetical protein